MIAIEMDLTSLMKDLRKRLDTFFRNAPFNLRYYIVGHEIVLQQLSTSLGYEKGPAISIYIDWFMKPSFIVGLVKKELIRRGWYPTMQEAHDIAVNPTMEDIEKLIASGLGLEEATLQASSRKIIDYWRVDRVNERANQMLLIKNSETDLYVYIMKIPISASLSHLVKTSMADAWTWFSQNSHLGYVDHARQEESEHGPTEG